MESGLKIISLLKLNYLFARSCRNISLGHHKQLLSLRTSSSLPRSSILMSNMSSSTSPTISLSHQDALVDEKLRISLSGLDKQAPVTLHAHVCESKMNFGSYACYITDDTGSVDLTRHESVKGTYTGLEPMGLFWSMEQEPGQQKGLRYWKRDVTEPVLVTLNVFKGHYSWYELYSKTMQPLVSTVITRWYKALNVKREPVRVGNIRGTLFLPPGDGPFLGVIDMFGSAGGLMEFRASLLASRGFACLALAYFAYDDLQKTLLNLNMDYFQEAVDWFMSQPTVIKDGIGVVAVSKGAEICQMLAVNCPKIHAAVLISGPPCCTALPIINNGKEVPTVIGDFDKFKLTDEGLIMRDAYNVEEYENVPKIEIWNSNAKVLNIVADDDQCAESSVLASHVNGYPEHLKCNIETVVYHDAGHLIEPPYSPFCHSSYNKLVGNLMVWGGKAKPHSDAQEDSWKRILSFLRENIIRKDSKPILQSQL